MICDAGAAPHVPNLIGATWSSGDSERCLPVRNPSTEEQLASTQLCGARDVDMAPTARFPFACWNGSRYEDLHVQGMEGVRLTTRQKVVLTRWDAAYRRSQGW
ncbi:MAG: hypothetical protein KGJ62_02350 [Armatimonadetes bacterium]|nr:hypothetical protein [Armatimonadota bacterium]MDE2205338.1 hypothetical protein [Armatimonadota bacterium]